MGISRAVKQAFASKMAGHTNTQTTMKYYTANDADMIREFAERMNVIHADAISTAGLGGVDEDEGRLAGGERTGNATNRRCRQGERR